MNRKKFIKSLLIGGFTGFTAPRLFAGQEQNRAHSTNDLLMQNVGFNHLPSQKNIQTMNSIIHKAETRGNANHGWLNSNHTFSFAGYHNPERMNFGVLRVLNDDEVQAGRGFGTHSHDNMEIISIPLEGDLEHKDSMGNTKVIKQGDVQVMSAGKGVQHSEYNKNKDRDVKFLQIWVFPNKRNVTPRYDQISTKNIAQENAFYQILSPNKDDQGVWIHQDAWFSIGKFEEGKSEEYNIHKKTNGVYLFVLEGEIEVEGNQLTRRDGMGLWNTNSFTVKGTKEAQVLLMEVPMNI